MKEASMEEVMEGATKAGKDGRIEGGKKKRGKER